MLAHAFAAARASAGKDPLTGTEDWSAVVKAEDAVGLDVLGSELRAPLASAVVSLADRYRKAPAKFVRFYQPFASVIPAEGIAAARADNPLVTALESLQPEAYITLVAALRGVEKAPAKAAAHAAGVLAGEHAAIHHAAEASGFAAAARAAETLPPEDVAEVVTATCRLGLGLSVRDRLDSAQLQALYAGFSATIPLSTLIGDQEALID